MNGGASRDGLRQALGSVLTLESDLEETLVRISARTAGFLETPAILGRLQSIVQRQRQALEAHIQALGDPAVPSIGPTISVASDPPPKGLSGDREAEPLGMLSAAAAAFARVAFAYAVLHALAHRSYDIATADLADRHRRSHLQSIQTIHRAAGDASVQALQESGHACRCQCPACGPGVCICWHLHVEVDGDDVAATAEGIVVRLPRAGSSADRAGLRHGDVILAVAGQKVGSYTDMRDRMGAHQPGDDVKLRIRRGTDEPHELTLKR